MVRALDFGLLVVVARRGWYGQDVAAEVVVVMEM
jgi:hypothetical protein